MTEPTTDAERVEWLWHKVEHLTAENASLQLALQTSESLFEAARDDARRAHDSVDALSQELMRMAIELNAARSAAATSVHDHLAALRT